MHAMLLAVVFSQATVPLVWGSGSPVEPAPSLFAGDPAPATAPRVKSKYELAYARAMQGDVLVVLIGADWCRPCQVTKKTLAPLLTTKGVAYVELDIEDVDAAGFNPKGEGKSIPQITVMGLVGKEWRVAQYMGSQSLATVKSAIEKIQKARGKPEAKEAPPVPVVKPSPASVVKPSPASVVKPSPARGAYRGSFNWTWPGFPDLQSLENHLAMEHSENAGSLMYMTGEQLVRLHDADHGSGRTQYVKTRRRGWGIFR